MPYARSLLAQHPWRASLALLLCAQDSAQYNEALGSASHAVKKNLGSLGGKDLEALKAIVLEKAVSPKRRREK